MDLLFLLNNILSTYLLMRSFFAKDHQQGIRYLLYSIALVCASIYGIVRQN